MATAILSTCLLTCDRGQELSGEVLLRAGDLLKFLNDSCTLEIEQYEGAPYDYMLLNDFHAEGLTWSNYEASNVLKYIQNITDDAHDIRKEDMPDTCTAVTLNLPDNDYKDAFLRYCCYKKNMQDQVLFVGRTKTVNDRKVTGEFKQGEENFQIDLSTAVTLELTDVLIPYLKAPKDWDVFFPRANVCKGYNSYVKNQPGSPLENKALFTLIGDLVAKINGYQVDQRLTKLNQSAKHKRIVYSKLQGAPSYLSFDWESGGFEVFDRKYVHQGQYNFDCLLAKKAEPKTHILKYK